ncbi:hypothetical protein [Nitrosomonas sp. Is37]|uniref:hypothetical protein n=1 Tax=Nitrosomonas sp. Is37 TaxID=3080535 RepID=UPI00294B45F7|nr:hypothetical protein [Nitrosomonas sp. Is37]MDV6345030.1 hypothetical protein [Nitrosomonas sp. Is37]
MKNLRQQLVDAALEWEQSFGVCPSITSAISEYDAALLLGMSIEDLSAGAQGKTAVQKGHDFIHNGFRYQIKANRPSGKPGSFVTLVPKAKNYEWDYLIWVLYDRYYQIQEAWLWDVSAYKQAFAEKNRLSPKDYRFGTRLA